jgi:hypothetical protein
MAAMPLTRQNRASDAGPEHDRQREPDVRRLRELHEHEKLGYRNDY